MFKLSMVETPDQRRLVLAGRLVSPWTQEVENAFRLAQADLDGRKLVVDLTDVTVISRDGEETILNLMRDGARFTCGGVLTKHLVRQLARRGRCHP